MKISFKRTASLALAAILAVSCFAGCKKTSDKDEQGRTIIKVGGYPTKEGPEKEKFDQKIKDFMAANKDINVQPDTYGFSVDTFFSKAAGKQLPTVFSTALTEVSTCIESGYIKDITASAKKHGYEGKINPRLLDGVIARDGVLYGIPTYTYALGIAFNAKLFEQAGLVDENGDYLVPKTWDEVAQFAKQIKDKTGKAGFVTGSIARIGGWLFTPIAWSFGVDFMEQGKDGKWKATFDSKEMVNALQFYHDLKWKYDVLPSDIALLDNTTAPQKLAAGEAAMLLRAPDFVRQLPAMGVDNADFGMFPMPAGPERHVTLLGGSLYMFDEAATDDQIDAAMRWTKTITYPDLNDDVKKSFLDTMDTNREKGIAIGLLELSNWDSETDLVKYQREYILENATIPLKNVKEYNKFVTGEGYKELEIQPEEPMCAQDLYTVVDSLVQEVFTNKNVDIAKIVKQANSDFQNNFLNNVSGN